MTAYILALNKLIGENDTMNAQTLPKVKMPNRDGFIVASPTRCEGSEWGLRSIGHPPRRHALGLHLAASVATINFGLAFRSMLCRG